MADRAFLERLTQELIDKGKLIEAGFVGLRLAAIPLDADKVRLREMKMAFFAGAQHLYASIMAALDPGDEPTERDLRRMELIDAELREFARTFSGAKHDA